MRSALGVSFLAIALISVLLLVSNLGTRLPVYFLTLQTRPQPLGLWFVLAIAAGLLTSAIIHWLIRSISSPATPSTSTGSSGTGPEPRARRRSDWTFMGRETGGPTRSQSSSTEPAEPWETGGWSARSRAESAPPPRSPRPEPTPERVIDTGFRVVKPPTTAAESSPSRRPSPMPSSTTTTGDDWDFVEQDDW
ncbi:hypothetical protein VZH09_03940 [Synechococcus elongatus IITB7]|uniref:hypothetical protein n=1 Tax=Synechococcus elongatus TaxID=32046 RepID=UPI0030D0B73A